MKRIEITPRKDWQSKVDSIGLVFHSNDNPYWNESAYYEFTADQIELLEIATNELHEKCLEAVQHVIDRKRYSELGIPSHAIPLIEASWEEEPPAIYGRFDFSYDGVGVPKMLEYNADTPTSLLEAAVAQWYWLQDVKPDADQFNSIHERLIAYWTYVRPYLQGEVVHFASLSEIEDVMTVTYLRDTAEQAGIRTKMLLMDQIGHDKEKRAFVDMEGERITTLFKLYPWEWMVHEEFGEVIPKVKMQWMEPAWKMILSNKGILSILWELFPDCPFLLPAHREDFMMQGEYVRKPLLSREGANVTIISDFEEGETGGDYGEEGYVYQELAPLPNFNGNRPVIGSWVIAGESAGIGIRESNNLITDNLSRFVPHLFY